jgi:hypothetical protein
MRQFDRGEIASKLFGSLGYIEHQLRPIEFKA